MRNFRELLEDNLSNVAKKQNAEKADIAKIRKDIQTTKTVVTKKSEDPTVVDNTTVTINDPTSNTKAVEKISADPRIATTTTITTKTEGGKDEFKKDLDHVLADVDKGSIAVPESVGDAAKPLYDLQDELGLEDNILVDELARYLDVDQIADFVERFRRHHELDKRFTENINEDLKPMDLESLVNTTISVDKHKSKLGEDKDVIVLAMEVKNDDAANDLMTFIERGYTDVIDADSISSENIDGDYIVFVEFERKDTFKDVLSEMLGGVEKLTGVNEWSFKHYKSNRTLTMEELHEKLPITPIEYDSFLANEQSIKDQLEQLKINARVPMK